MKILIIGNGFDLAHELPTKYIHFLDFVKKMKDLIPKGLQLKEVGSLDRTNLFKNFNFKNTNETIKESIKNNIIQGYCNGHNEELLGLIQSNVWIEYFFKCDMHGEENWIDFESEISGKIQLIDKNIRKRSLYEEISCLDNGFMEDWFYNNTNRHERITYKKVKEKLLNDLNRLIRALEIYLTDYVEKIDILDDKLSKDIDQIISNIDKIISFNYTHTYKNYKIKSDVEVDFLHGEAKSNNTIETNNMVLGIDEYLSEDEQRNHIEFIEFKKFYQRIYKKTGEEYRKWVDEMRQEYTDYINAQKAVGDTMYLQDEDMINEETKKILDNQGGKNEVYIFGHSLDITDGDILRDLILNENVYTTIYYCSREQNSQQIANLVKVIGENELIKRTGGKNRTIEFKMQTK